MAHVTQRLSLEDPTFMDEHVKATLRRLSRFSGTGSNGLAITPSEVERLQHTFVTAYSSPLGDTIVEEGLMEYRVDGPDRSLSLDVLQAPLLPGLPPNADRSYVHPKTFRPATSLDQSKN
jgi:hypothetical protein